MVRVQCKVCGDIGYTVCPSHAACKCGGKFAIIPENGEAIKFTWFKKKLNTLIYFLYPWLIYGGK